MKPQDKKLLWILAAILLWGTIAVAIYSYVVYGTILPIPQTCSIGISGTAANVTFTGINASAVCDGNVQGTSQAYLMSGTPQGAEICEGDIQEQNHSVHYIVRDTGLFNIVGSSICAKLSGGTSTTPSDTPTPTPNTQAFIPGQTCTADATGQNCVMCAVGVQGHDAVAEFTHDGGTVAQDDCNNLLAQKSYYFAEPIPSSGTPSWESMPVVCHTQGTESITVYDDGGQLYGTEMCHELGIATQ